ncbi:uncharacterized protein LOC129805214 [Phlebotomus papatasi]|uniref:uncharacterized protein LOC129805214 n=1 Tax=Phlebotomus papatasi TaxID=29031 RepID=UPI002483DBD0|nr:uncharacterized protein LOC129805214 [Phlebotomus papatasi]
MENQNQSESEFSDALINQDDDTYLSEIDAATNAASNLALSEGSDRTLLEDDDMMDTDIVPVITETVSNTGSTMATSAGSDRTLPNETANKNVENNVQLEGMNISLPAQQKSPRKRKFTTSQRKHLRRLLDSGVKYEDAAAQVLSKPKPSPPVTSEKRKRSDNATPPENRDSKKPKANVSYSETLKTFRVCLIHKEHPVQMLTREQMNLLEAALSEEIVNIPEDGPRVQFRNWFTRPGWVMVDCADEISEGWIMGVVTQKQLVGGVQVKAVKGENMPKTATCTMWIPATDKTPPGSILERIRKQNDLQTERWRVLKIDTDEKGRTIVLSIDENSINKLKKVNMKVFYLLRQIEIRLKTGVRKPKPKPEKKKNAANSDVVKPAVDHTHEANKNEVSQPTSLQTPRAVRSNVTKGQPTPGPSKQKDSTVRTPSGVRSEIKDKGSTSTPRCPPITRKPTFPDKEGARKRSTSNPRGKSGGGGIQERLRVPDKK